MKVRATMTGYYGDMLRYAGDMFELVARTEIDRRGKKVEISPEDQFSHEWMERVDGGPVPAVKRKMPDDVIAPPPPPSNPRLATTPTSRVTPPATVGASTETPVPTGNKQVI